MSSQRILVALDTGNGVVYAPASGWDRVYVLWTFRNFRSLPHNVLSPRQQLLIGSLYRAAPNYRSHELNDAVVVGTVENFKASPLPTPPAKLAGLVEDRRGTKSATSRTLGRTPTHARLANRMVLQVGTVALVVTLGILTWHRLRSQAVTAAPSPQIAIAHPTGESMAIGNDAVTEDLTTKQPAPAIVEPVVNPVAALPSAVSLISTNARLELSPSHVGIHHAIPASAKIYDTAADQPRMQISGRPRKLVYPVCPETQARGKVSLQALVEYDGVVSRVRVLTGDRALAAAAVEAVRQWRYEPFSGVAPRMERETNITISFISNEVVAVSFPSPAVPR